MKVAQSYIHHNGERFFISTIERESSALLAYGARYNETIVWKWNEGEPEREQKILIMESGITGSIKTHLEVCEKIFRNGIYEQ
jgi:hypothetical protein